MSSQLEQLHPDLAVRVDREDARGRDVDRAVRHGVGDAVAEAGVEGRLGRAKEPLNVAQAGHLEDLGLAENDLAGRKA
jgi:hypothetical protein